MNCRSIDIVNLFRFIRLFNISLFSILETTAKQIRAVVAWADSCQRGLPEYDDTQEIIWRVPQISKIEDALLLGEFTYDNGWISSDRITISRAKLREEIGWDNTRFSDSIEILLTLRASMIDEDEETDSFFLHFE